MASPIASVYAKLLDREYQREIFGDLPGFVRKGLGYIARCPFHDDVMPTMVIYGERPEYFCFACSTRGDWIRYITEGRGKTFHEALAVLERAAGCETSGYTEDLWEHELSRSQTLETSMSTYVATLWSKSGEDVLHYLYDRGYATGEVKGMALGCFPGQDETLKELLVDDPGGPGVVIPYRDGSGRLMGLMFRDIGSRGPESYAPLTTLEGLTDVPFLLYRSRGQHDVILVEGLLDSLLLDQLRLKPVMGIGAGGLSEGMLRTATDSGSRHFILALGNGDRRRSHTISAIKLAIDAGLAVSVLPISPRYKDIDEFIRQTCLDHYRALLKKAIPGREWLAAYA